MPEQPMLKRSTAVKSLISDIVNSEYFKEDGAEPNYILTKNNEKISRVNIIGAVIAKEDSSDLGYKSLLIDDGSGSIGVRFFESVENGYMFNNVAVGDIVIVIGKPRLYGSEIYVVPEIVKKEQMKWLELRKKELGLSIKPNMNPFNIGAVDAAPKSIGLFVGKAAEFEKISDDAVKSTADKIIELINTLDSGDGVPIEDIIKMLNKPDSDRIINDLMKNGDIFMFKPGRIKVL
jgi:hypothetical protein